MNTYIALLRGINVSGQKKIKMAELREHLAELPLHNIQTYIQSGNILFDREETEVGIIEEEIRAKIEEKYGFDVPTMVKTKEDLEHVIAQHPFIHQRHEDPKLVHVTFLAGSPEAEHLANLTSVDYPSEEYQVDRTFFYLFAPNGYGRAKLNNNFIERKLKVRATTRNWKTVTKLLEMASGD